MQPNVILTAICIVACHYSIDKEMFLRCSKVAGITCKTCGHSYINRFHEYAENREVTEPVDYLDTTAKAKYEAAKSMEEKKELLLAKLNTKKKSLKSRGNSYLKNYF